MKAYDKALIVVFLAIILLPGVGLVAGFGGAGAAEKRELAPIPAFPTNWTTLREWPDAFTTYFEDHFALRTQLVSAQAEIRLKALSVSPSPRVIAGREGWLYYAEDGALDDYVTLAPLSAGDLRVWRETLQANQDWLKEQGIAYAFVIAPDKHAVYPEMMPASIHRLQPRTWTDQLVEDLRAHSTVNVVDLRPVLDAGKADERLYQRTDTHWNARGAHLAYVTILASLGGAHGLTARPRSAFDAREALVPGMDLAGMLGLTHRLTEEDLELVPRQPRLARVIEPLGVPAQTEQARLVTVVPDDALPRAVVFRDSFFSALIPFLSEHFSRAVYLWEYDVDPAVIAAERPQVVIQEIVGRHLGMVLPYNYVADLTRTGEARRGESGAAEAPRNSSRASPE